jgi:hypothetical protein
VNYRSRDRRGKMSSSVHDPPTDCLAPANVGMQQDHEEPMLERPPPTGDEGCAVPCERSFGGQLRDEGALGSLEDVIGLED